MKILIILLGFLSFLFACVGDCTACHQKILKDGNLTKGHEKLATCKICHTQESLEKIDMGDAACGQDCWECHSLKKVINSGVKEHEVLSTCRDCHHDLKENIFSTIKQNQGSLQDFLEK